MKTYFLKFGSGDSASYSGLTPTFIIFSTYGITAVVTPPGITETPSGSGLYNFGFSPTLPIIFKCDGGAALSSVDRYVYGSLDAIQSVDEKVGTPTDVIGNSTTDPTTLFGQAKRNQEFNEGDATFTKSTGIWTVYDRTGATLIASKTLANNTTSATKA